jgi:hypothetical protein
MTHITLALPCISYLDAKKGHQIITPPNQGFLAKRACLSTELALLSLGLEFALCHPQQL